MKVPVLILFISFFFNSNAQNDTIYFNADWKTCTAEHAKFYRLSEKRITDFLVRDFYLNNNIQMIAEYSSIIPEVKNGHCSYHDERGNLISHGFYKNNKYFGRWVWYDSTFLDSTIADYDLDGKRNFIRKSKGFKEKVYVETMPSFPGGSQAMYKFINKKIRYPRQDRKAGIQGKVIVRFVIDTDGKITDIKIYQSVSPSLDAEVLRVVNKMPAWQPGYQNETAVKVEFKLPVIFSLQD